MSAATPGINAMLLSAMPGTCTEIRLIVGSCKTTTIKRVQDMHSAGGCHISAWRRKGGGGIPVAVFSSGPGKDAKCRIVKFTQKQKYTREINGLRESGKWAEHLAKMRSKYWDSKAKSKPNTWAASLFFGRGAA